MSSSDNNYVDISPGEASSEDVLPASRRRSRTRTPHGPRKKRRLGSVDPSQIRQYELEGKYNDGYRQLFNEHVTAGQFQDEPVYYSKQVGTSAWSSTEQAAFFAALGRLGKDSLPGIAGAIGTKSESEVRDFLLLLQDAAARQANAKVTLRDIPAAVEVGSGCDLHMDEAAEALAWYQERLEATQEKERYAEYWLITPRIADDIESAVNPGVPSRAGSPTTASEPETSYRGVAGSCTPCKTRKRKCDRGTPCANCAKCGQDCVYSKKLHPISQQEDSKASTSPAQKQEDAAPEAANSTSAQILDEIPEAQLLKPQVMLTLAKDIFMNRSPDIPSPWPHWSMYASEMADEPALYRTALNDFHRLAVSITKRLVHTAMFQASSRLRAQRTRTNKGISPIVKVRDVDTAINVLGLKRNGNERWKGVARRCNLRVSGGKLAATGRLRKEMSWREVERELTEPSTDTHATDSETTVEPEEFRSRAMRSGTPLPMQDLTISDSDDNIDESDGDGDDDNLKEEEGFAFQPREPSGRYTSVRPTSSHDTPQPQMYTLEEFDQQARRQEERALWDMLGHEPSVKDNSDDEVGDDASLEDEKITTEPSGWRASIDYRAPWETFHRLPLFPETSPPPAQPHSLENGASSDSSSTTSTRRPRTRKPPVEVELRTQGAKAYAASRGNNMIGSSDVEPDIPSQSIEAAENGGYF